MFSKVFHDFESFSHSVQSVESKMLLPSPGNRTWTIHHVDLKPVEVQTGLLGSGNIAQGELRSDGFMVYIPLTNGVQYTANGVELQRNSAVVLEPGCEFCICTKDEHDWTAAFVPSERLDPRCLEYSESRCKVVNLETSLLNTIRNLQQQALQSAMLEPDFESSDAAELISQEITSTFDTIILGRGRNSFADKGRPKADRDQIIQRVLEFLENHEGEAVRIQDLINASSVSERTLRNVFQEYFGVSPKRFLQVKQLNDIRKRLKNADPENTTVSNILVNYGEWSFGRFSARYRDLFGELPSETLRQSN